MDTTKIIMGQLKKLHLLSKTQFIILYGSVASGKENSLSDIDICISLTLPPKERLKARINLSGALPEKYDLQIFEDLPLYVQKEIFKGKILYCKNTEHIVKKAFQIIHEYEDFEPIYLQYITKNLGET